MEPEKLILVAEDDPHEVEDFEEEVDTLNQKYNGAITLIVKRRKEAALEAIAEYKERIFAVVTDNRLSGEQAAAEIARAALAAGVKRVVINSNDSPNEIGIPTGVEFWAKPGRRQLREYLANLLEIAL